MPHHQRFPLGVLFFKRTCISHALFWTVSYRLVNGYATAGRLEISINGQWGTVCDDYWNDNNYPNVTQGSLNAQVACKSLGLTWKGAYPVPRAGYGQGSSLPILMDDVKCTGNEPDLYSCPRRVSGYDCDNSEDVGRSWWCTYTQYQTHVFNFHDHCLLRYCLLW